MLGEVEGMDLEIEILDRLYNSTENFMSRTSQELKRAQRYLDFLSYLIVDTSHLKNIEFDNSRSGNDFYRKLRHHIRISIRQTDIISGFNKGKICILLVDTPAEGATAVERRLQESIRYFLHEIINSPKNWKVEIVSNCFPTDNATPSSVLDNIRSALTA
ncbi:MAG: diguanylate cyclase [candidate division Zixibacteria bacterium]|nr:diguanylate cyclase [candidate division Zixibacteria bacterium]